MSDQKDSGIQNDNIYTAVSVEEQDFQRPHDIVDEIYDNFEMNNTVSVATKSQWQAILDGIKSEENETLRLQCLMELCNHLVVLTEDHLNGFKVDQFIPPLVSMLKDSDDPNLLLFVCRAFSHLLEALPASVGFIIRNKAVPALCEKLLSIEYIDLAEQVINALLKISDVHNGATEILKSGGLMALLTYLDFFSIDIQYKAITTAMNILTIIPNDCIHIVRDSFDLFNQLLDHQDPKILEKTCICIYRIVKCLGSSKKDLNRLKELGVVSKLVNILIIYSRNIGQEESSMIDCSIRSITLMVNKDGSLVELLLKNNLSLILKHLVENEKKRDVKQKVKRAQFLYNIICLIDAMLPDAKPNSTHTNFLQENVDQKEMEVKAQIYENEPTHMKQTLHHLLDNLVEIYGERSSVSIKQKCLSSIFKMTFISNHNILREELKDLSFSHFIVQLLGSNDFYTVTIALTIAVDLMEKLPDIFSVYFVREGVIHEINQLIEKNKIDEECVLTDDVIMKKIEIYQSAMDFKSKYFSEEDKNQTNELRILHTIASSILEFKSNGHEDSSKQDILTQLSECLNHGISTYELIQSGLIESLLEFLAFDDSSLSIHERRRIRESHVRLFRGVFFSDEKNTSIWSLLNECQHALQKMEHFEADTLSTQEIPISYLKYLSKSFTFKFVPHKNENRIKESISVYAEPLATIADVKMYLKLKLMQKSRMAIEDDYDSEEEIEPIENEEEEEEEDIEEQFEQEEYDEEEMIEEMDEEEDEEEYDDEEIEEEEYEEENDDVVKLSDIEDLQQTAKKYSNKSFEADHVDLNDIENQKLRLFFKDLEFKDTDNVFRCVFAMNKLNQPNNPTEYRGVQRFWSQKYEIEYLHVDPQVNDSIDDSENSAKPLEDIESFFTSPIDEIVEEMRSQSKKSSLNDLLYLIKLIYTICIHKNSYSELSPSSSFTNSQLTTKIIRITQDPLLLCSGVLPDWTHDLIRNHQHLFNLDVRTHYFRSTSFGISRALLSMKDRLEEFMKFRLGRIYCQKVRIHRDKILESAFVIFKKISSSSILEIEYFDEVATGLGPTLEFFTLLSHEYQRKDLNLWMNYGNEVSKDNQQLSYHPFGLFPIPTDQSSLQGDENLHQMLYYNFGCFIAKSILDQRLIDVHLSTPLIKFLIGEKLTINCMNEIFPELCQVIKELNELLHKKKHIEQDETFSKEDKAVLIKELTYKNANIEDLSLYFVLPGYNLPLIEGGDDILVTIDNLEQYVNRMIQVLVKESIEIQINSIRDGFNSVFDSKHLCVFNPLEINTMISGSSEKNQDWDKETILENTICDHGFTSSSRTVQFMVEMMSEFTVEERRNFLRFITGSPRLPPGGFKGLNPKLTFVRKEAVPPLIPDDYLPSVSTCFLYIKMPEYSTKEIMKKKLMIAIENGQSGFSLS